MDVRRAYCSACDRNVPVRLKADVELDEQPSPRDARALVCLDYRVRCTGWLCPLFSVDDSAELRPLHPGGGAGPGPRPT